MDMAPILKKFQTNADCIAYIEKIKWGNCPKCPYCGSIHCSNVKDEPKYKTTRYHCNKCNATFSVLVGTILQDSKIELQKWFLAIILVASAQNPISSRQLAKTIVVNHKTAWVMQKKIKHALQQNGSDLVKGIIEIGETILRDPKYLFL